MNTEMFIGAVLIVVGFSGLLVLAFFRLDDLHKRLFNIEYPSMADREDDAAKFWQDEKR